MAETTDPLERVIDDFELLDDWEDRYRYVIDLGRQLEPLPDEARVDANKVRGCASQVWLETIAGTGPDPIMRFRADSDAHIVRGLVALMVMLHSGRPASEIVALDADGLLKRLGLNEHLSPQRANGLRSMIGRIRQEAQARLA